MMSATRRIQGVPKPPSHDSGLGVGVGAGVFYTVISCHEEIKRLNKTVEQMEYFIQEMRQQLQHHHENLLSLSCSGSQSVHSVEIETVSSQGSKNNVGQRIQPFGLTRSIDPELCIEDQTSTRQVMSRGQSVESCRMAALEAELEAELELMELNMNAVETFPDQSMTTSKEVQTSYFSDASPHGLLETSNLGRHSTHLEEAPTDYAVSPIELDLRLRHILEAQQQERVLELELLLKETEAKLLAKDQELLCWKHHVHSLTNGFQPLSACGTDMLSFNNASGTNSAPSSDNVVDAVPQATKSTLELFQSFQDPPISMELNNVGSANGSVLSENIFKKQRNLSNFSVNLCSNNRSFLNEASDSSSPLDFVNVVTESNTCWHVQGTGIDTPESIIMEEIDVHTPVQVKSEIFRGQSVSRTSETSDCTLHDEWSSDMLPLCHSPCEHPDSFLVNVGTKDTPPSRVKVFPSESNPSPNSHHMKRKPNIKTTTSLSSDPFRSKDAVEGDCSDVKHIVDSFKLKPDFLHVRNPGPAQEPVQAPRRILNLNSESLQIVTRGLRRSLTLQESSMEVKSPVLDKIRHWEVLAGHIGSKTSS